MIKKEVICVNDIKPLDLSLIEGFTSWVVKGRIYTIRKIQQNLEGDWGVLLEEISNPTFTIKLQGNPIGNSEMGFNINRFRYLDGTDIKATMQQEELVNLN